MCVVVCTFGEPEAVHVLNEIIVTPAQRILSVQCRRLSDPNSALPFTHHSIALPYDLGGGW